MFPEIGSYYEEGGSRPNSAGIPIPPKSIARPHSPGKFKNQVEDSRAGSGDKKIHLEVTITADQLREILKCQPSEEVLSRAGTNLKRAFPELGKAKEAEKKEKALEERRATAPELDYLPFDIKYSSLVNWKGSEEDDANVKNEYMQLMKYVILREGSIRQISALVQAAESAYWKYASVIINRLEFDHSILTDDVAQMKAHINKLQEELSVALAHHRSLSIAVVEAVQSWRRISKKSTRIVGTPSVHFEGENYLLKMTTDTIEMLQPQTMKMWLGFEPNMFMVPPAYHNPHKCRVAREELRRGWIKGRDAWMDAQLERLKNLGSTNITFARRASAVSSKDAEDAMTSGRGSSRRPSMAPGGRDGGMASSQSTPLLSSARARVTTITTVGRAGGLEASASAVEIGGGRSASNSGSGRRGSHNEDTSNKSESDDGDDEEDAMRAPRRVTTVSTHSEEDDDSDPESEAQSQSEETSTSGSASTNSYSQVDEDWQTLRDQCAASWPSKADPEAEAFWQNYDLNPLTVEAAVCFVDVFPTIFIVPPVQLALVNRCLSCEVVIKEEVEMVARTAELKSECRSYKEEVFCGDQLQKAMDEIDTEEKRLGAIIEQQMLVTRQTTNRMRNILQFQYIPLPRHTKARRAMFRGGGRVSPRSSTATHMYTNPLSRMGTPSNATSRTLNSSSNPFSVFLTAAGDDHVRFEEPKNIEYHIDVAALRAEMEARVDRERNRLCRIGDALVIVKDPKLRLGRDLNTKKKRLNPVEAAIRLQAAIRGLLTRLRLKRSNRAMQKMLSVLTIQRYIRMYLGKSRAKVKKRQYRNEMMMLRKAILRKNKAASIVQHFFRYVVFLANRARFVKKYDVKVLALRDPARLELITRSLIKIQKVFRGHIARKDLARYFRKLHKDRDKAKMTRRTSTYSIAGSGGFKFRRKTDADFESIQASSKKASSKPVMRTDPKLLQLIQQEDTFFQTLLARDADHMKVQDDLSTDSSVNTETKLKRQGSALFQQRKAYCRLDSFGAAVVSGRNVMNTASNGNRVFIIDKLKKASDLRKANKAYVNPNVHKKPLFMRSGSFESQDTQTEENEVRNLLENILH